MTRSRGTELLDSLKNALKDEIPRPKYELLIAPLSCEQAADNKLVLGVESAMLQTWIEEQYGHLIREHAGRIMGGPVELEFQIVAPEFRSMAGTSVQDGRPGFSDEEGTTIAEKPTLNPRFTFENFVVGPANSFAYSASLAVAERPGYIYNPLFIYSGVGLGKTHLLHSIGHLAYNLDNSLWIKYVTSEKFTNDFIHKVRGGRMEEFYDIYRQVDVLLIDDIQFLAGRTETQQEFFHTFNILVEQGKQVVISSDRSPKDLKNLDDRLVSRFSGGLITDIAPPSFETRIAILEKKAKLEGVTLPQDIGVYIAKHITDNIRDLEGSLIRLLAYTTHRGEPLTLETAEVVLGGLIDTKRTGAGIDITGIISTVCEYFNLNSKLLLSPNRTKKVAFARQITMYLAREHTNLSLAQIGSELGGRDHSTVIYACEKIRKEMVEDPYVELTIKNLSKLIT
ncbi:MAG: chromosomal replication initiator protein DnaA [bacterium]|jgi:chromosomal replication initiator protein